MRTLQCKPLRPGGLRAPHETGFLSISSKQNFEVTDFDYFHLARFNPRRNESASRMEVAAFLTELSGMFHSVLNLAVRIKSPGLP